MRLCSGTMDRVITVALLVLLAATSFVLSNALASVMEGLFCVRYSRMLWTAAVMGIAGVALTVRYRRLFLLAILVGFAVSVCTNWLPPTSRGLFLDDLYSIKRGMTTAQVEAKMKRYTMSGGGTYITFYHSDSDEYGGDCGIVVLRHGKVIYTEFSSD